MVIGDFDGQHGDDVAVVSDNQVVSLLIGGFELFDLVAQVGTWVPALGVPIDDFAKCLLASVVHVGRR